MSQSMNFPNLGITIYVRITIPHITGIFLQNMITNLAVCQLHTPFYQLCGGD